MMYECLSTEYVGPIR